MQCIQYLAPLHHDRVKKCLREPMNFFWRGLIPVIQLAQCDVRHGRGGVGFEAPEILEVELEEEACVGADVTVAEFGVIHAGGDLETVILIDGRCHMGEGIFLSPCKVTALGKG